MRLTFILLLSGVIFSAQLLAEQDDVGAFINASVTPTYDCPDSRYQASITDFMQRDSLTTAQRHALTVMQTHSQICNGNNNTAETTLNALINERSIDKSARYFAAAVYQLGFLHDVKASPQKCDFYQQAQTLAEDQFVDIHLSATLGLITECQGDTDEGVRLGKLFTLLEQYSAADQPGAVAHIHNNIGLLFGQLGQNVLAAEQYIKAHRIGLEIYTGSNQLSILISAISAYMASGNYERAEQAINEFRQLNQNINTPLTNFWLLFAEAGFYYRTEQFSLLRDSIAKWQEMKAQINNVTYENLFRWYSAVLCLAEKDEQCLRDFLAQEQLTSPGYQRYVGGNKYYLKFITDVHFFLGNYADAEEAYRRFADTLFDEARADQASSRVLGIANLYSQINSLENRLNQARQARNRLIVLSVTVLLVIIVVLVVLIRKRQRRHEAIDSVTQLLNNSTSLRRIEHIPPPSEGKTNALAIFDLGNFREVNRLVGSTKADYVLKQIADTFKNITRNTDIIGRFAPEQFILCLPDIEENTAKTFFERIRHALENTTLTDDNEREISVRSSMSIYIATDRFTNIDEILDDMLLSLSIQN